MKGLLYMSHLSEMLAVLRMSITTRVPLINATLRFARVAFIALHACRLSEAMAPVAITDILLKINNEIQLCKA